MSIFTKCFPTITLELSDNFPNKICNDCLAKLRQFAIFVERVQSVQSEFNSNVNHSAQDATQESVGYNSGAEQITDESPKTIVIKQEPIVNVKQEIIDFSRSAIVNSMPAATTMLNLTRNPDTLPQNDAYCEFCDAYFLHNFELKSHIVKYHSNGCRENATKTANNCEIMEIITLDNVMMIDLVGKSTGGGYADTIANEEQMIASPMSPIAMPYPATILKVETLNEFEQRENVVRSLLGEHSYSRPINEPNVGLRPVVKFLKQEDGIQLQQNNAPPVQSFTPAFEVFESNICVEPAVAAAPVDSQIFESIEIDSQPISGAKCCPLCFQECRDMYQYLVHKKVNHSRETLKRKSSNRFSAICHDCSALFLTKLAFTNHRNYMCPVRRGITYQCPFCRLNFVKWLEMRQHSKQCLVGQAISTLKSIGVQCDVPDTEETNTKKCRYACEQCGRSYGRKTNLVRLALCNKAEFPLNVNFFRFLFSIDTKPCIGRANNGIKIVQTVERFSIRYFVAVFLFILLNLFSDLFRVWTLDGTDRLVTVQMSVKKQ